MTRAGAPQDDSLVRSTTVAAAWSASSRLLILIVQFAGTVVVARILAPSEYGLVVLATAFTMFAMMFTDLGLGAAVVHADEDDDDLLSAAFWVNLVTGVVLTLALGALAHPLAAFFGHPALARLLLVGSLAFTVAVGTVPLSILERRMQFARIAVIEFLTALIGWAIAVALAVAGVGPLCVIIGTLVQVALASLLTWQASRWMPHGLGSRAALHQLWSFSSPVFGFNVINYWSRNLDDIMLGKYTSATSLAFYNRAYQFMLLPVQQVTFVIGRVLFPALTRLRDDVPRLRAAYLRALTLLFGIAAPLSVALAASAPAVIAVVYGPAWHDAAPLLAVLAASGPAQVVTGTIGSLYRALGLTASQFRRSIINTVLTVAAIFIGLPWGAMGVAVAMTVKFYLLAPLNLQGCWRFVDISVPSVVWRLRTLIASSLVMAAAILLVGRFTHGWPAVGVLFAQWGAGLVVYSLSVLVVAREFGREVATVFGFYRLRRRWRPRAARGAHRQDGGRAASRTGSEG